MQTESLLEEILLYGERRRKKMGSVGVVEEACFCFVFYMIKSFYMYLS